MRVATFALFQVLIVGLLVCFAVTRKSKRPIRFYVQWLLLALLPPMIGNSMLIISSDWLVARIGCYLYYIGLDWSVMALLSYTLEFCRTDNRQRIVNVASTLILADIVQVLANIFMHHCFDTHPILVDDRVYWALTPFFGQTVHRVVAYGVFFLSVFIFLAKLIGSPRIYKERYAVILGTMVVVGVWETFYIMSGTPVDLSMIGFGAFGMLVFYFSLYYKPFRLLDRMLASVVSSMDEVVFFFDRDDSCIYANSTAERLFGIRDEQDLEASVERARAIVGEEQFDLAHDWSCQRSSGTMDDRRYWDIDFRTLTDERGDRYGAYLIGHDRTEEERDIQRQRYLATHDSLTGLYNKEYLYEKARRMMDRQPERRWCVLALDIKEFKLINDIYSKEVGDEVLRGMADFMRRQARDEEIYGRLTGDKFGSVIPYELFDQEYAERSLEQLSNISEINQTITMHMGVYEVVERDIPVSVMFDRAFMAIASIKNDFQHHVAIYDDRMRQDVIWNQKISSELDEAIATGQLRPYLQPMVNSDGVVQGAEVLVRWIHPEEGFLPPYRFIPYFEESGRIAQLDRYMWECSCKILRSWQDRGIDLFLSVNISPKDFYFIDVCETIQSLVQTYGVRPDRLRLEITETVMMSDVDNRLRIVENLRKSGFLVEMDDFGSGYSSLNMLKDMPVDVLKIDMMFLYKTKDQVRAQTILQTIVNLTHALGIPSVTEGVETSEQLRMLVDMGCRLFQGYYFAKPMPFEEFEENYVTVA